MEKELTKRIATIARKARVSLGLTQEDAAEKIGVSVEFYSRIERGNALPSLKTFIRMAVAFGVSTDKLIGIAEDDDVPAAIELYHAPPPDDPPELKRLVRRLRSTPNPIVKVVDDLLKALEKVPWQIPEDEPTNQDDGKPGQKAGHKSDETDETDNDIESDDISGESADGESIDGEDVRGSDESESDDSDM